MFVYSYLRFGFDGILVRIEADLSRGIPGVEVTGLAHGAVRESRERIKSAFRHSGFKIPQDRVLINLAPAEVRKEDAALDLPIALVMLAASAQIPAVDNVMALGELELSGNLRPVPGILAAAARAVEEGVPYMIVPRENKAEAALLMKGRVAGASTLKEAADAVVFLFENGAFPEDSNKEENSTDDGAAGAALSQNEAMLDFSDVRSQERYKRALEIAAAGGHNALVFGPPGAGKTMLARRFSTIFPDIGGEDAVTVTRLHSLAGLSYMDGAKALILRPPVRSPHHLASMEGILGGGKYVKPGEVSLSHAGVLFLDEAPQFRRNVLQGLREPIEEKRVRISRAQGQVVFPADFQLLLTANPCPCGKLGSGGGGSADGCYCSDEEINRYWRKFGGALLDRVELRVAVKNSGLDIFSSGAKNETSAEVRSRVARAVDMQKERFKGTTVRRNAAMSVAMIDKHCAMDEAARNALVQAAGKLQITGRAYHGILRTARTIADLEGAISIKAAHILEAVVHRRLGDDPYDVLRQC